MFANNSQVGVPTYSIRRFEKSAVAAGPRIFRFYLRNTARYLKSWVLKIIAFRVETTAPVLYRFVRESCVFNWIYSTVGIRFQNRSDNMFPIEINNLTQTHLRWRIARGKFIHVRTRRYVIAKRKTILVKSRLIVFWIFEIFIETYTRRPFNRFTTLRSTFIFFFPLVSVRPKQYRSISPIKNNIKSPKNNSKIAGSFYKKTCPRLEWQNFNIWKISDSFGFPR